MSDTAAPGPLPPPPPRSSHGCLWGCLIAALIAAGVLVASFGYLGWYLFAGFKNDATLHMVIETVNRDQAARAVLGDGIAVSSVSSTSINSDLATGTTSSYVAHVKGSRADGTLEATVVTQNHKSRITVLILTGPDGHRYDLAGGGPQAPPNNSI